MKKHTLLFAAAITALTASAQETYLDGTLLKPQLSGTARYVGMGGAMEALGADISTIGTNPAGIGLFRHSTANLTFGLVSQQDAPDIDGTDKTHASFDQAGFVYSMRTGRNSFLNFAFNYTKDRDFNQLINPYGKTNGSSQSEVTAAKGHQGVFNYDVSKDGMINSNSLKFTQLDYLYSNLMCYGEDKEGGYWRHFPKQVYDMQQRQWGYVGKYDLNISGNIKDRVYLGATVGIHDVHFNSVADYLEMASDGESYINSIEENTITGTGFDIKAGVIFRPVAESPFRIGLSVATPTFYSLTMSNYTELYFEQNVEENGNIVTYKDGNGVSYDYDFRLNTPWRFGASLGHTVGNMLALGVSYEFADYGKTDNREIDGYDAYGYETSSSDRAMNHHTQKTLKAVSTLKVGAEFRPDPLLAVRLGFNYVSPMYEKNGYKPGDILSVGNAMTGTSFTNWEETYRVTAGVGYRIDKFNIDLAYQYNTTNGTFSPYDSYYVANAPERVKVSDKRHQVMLTLGYTF